MTTTMGWGRPLRERLWAIFTTLALIFSMVAFNAATASASIDLEIPIDTRAHGLEGSSQVLATAETGDLAGLECTVSAQAENNTSVHPDNDLVVASGTTSVVLEDVESVPGALIEAEGVLILGDMVTVTLVFGPDQVFSAGLIVLLDCDQVVTVEVTVTATSCAVDPQGNPLGSVSVTISPDSGATVTVYSDAAKQNAVGSFSGTGGSLDLAPGTYYWSAVAADGHELTGPAGGEFTIADCLSGIAVVGGNCTLGPDGEVSGYVDVTIDPDSSATVVVYDAGNAVVASFTSSGTADLSPGDYTWEATASSGFSIEGVTSGTFTVVDCDTPPPPPPPDDPTISIEVSGVCDDDIPFLSYNVVLTNYFPTDTPSLTIHWFDTSDNEHSPVDPGLSPDPFSGIVLTDNGSGNWSASGEALWPGARVDSSGNPTDWPGWELQDGEWVQTDDGFAWSRDGAYVVAEVNPTSDPTEVFYAPATPECNPNPPTEVLDLEVLPFTGLDTNLLVALAIALMGVGFGTIQMSHRREDG